MTYTDHLVITALVIAVTIGVVLNLLVLEWK